jgi:hypothetical protein
MFYLFLDSNTVKKVMSVRENNNKRKIDQATSSLYSSPAKKKVCGYQDEKPVIGFGVGSFRELVEKNTIFADKTLLIEQIINQTDRVMLITCPRGWGKTINMSMIQTFFEIQMDEKRNN